MSAIALHPFVNDLHIEGQTPLEINQGNVATLKLKGFALSALEKICYVALVAIIGVVFAASYNLIVLTGSAPALMAGVILVSPLLVVAPAKLAQWSSQYYALAEFEEKVNWRLKEIELWDRPEVERFFQENHLLIDLLPVDALRSANAENPIKALLPLIARFDVLKNEAGDLLRKHDEAPVLLEESFRRKESETGKELDAELKQRLRYESEVTHWRNLEEIAIPSALKAATLLLIIQNPLSTGLEIAPFSMTIDRVGSCAPRKYSQRIFGKERGNDFYFHFVPGLGREPLTHAQIAETELDPVQLRPLLYPSS